MSAASSAAASAAKVTNGKSLGEAQSDLGYAQQSLAQVNKQLSAKSSAETKANSAANAVQTATDAKNASQAALASAAQKVAEDDATLDYLQEEIETNTNPVTKQHLQNEYNGLFTNKQADNYKAGQANLALEALAQAQDVQKSADEAYNALPASSQLYAEQSVAKQSLANAQNVVKAAQAGADALTAYNTNLTNFKKDQAAYENAAAKASALGVAQAKAAKVANATQKTAAAANEAYAAAVREAEPALNNYNNALKVYQDAQAHADASALAQAKTNLETAKANLVKAEAAAKTPSKTGEKTPGKAGVVNTKVARRTSKVLLLFLV